MPKTTPLQDSFSSGEISPKLIGRVSAPGYQSGLIEMSNMIADSRGPAVSRVGTRYTTQLDGNDGRVVAFNINDTAGYIFVFTDLKLTPVTYAGTPVFQNFVTNSKFRDNNTGWTEDIQNGSTSYLPDLLRMTCDDSANTHVYVGQGMTITDAGDYLIAIGGLATGGYEVRVGTALDDDTYGSWTVASGGLFIQEVTGIPAGTIWITVRNVTRDSTVELTQINFLDQDNQTDFVTLYTEADLNDLHFAVAPGGDDVYVMHPNYPTYKMSYSYVSDSFTWAEVTFTSPPTQWTGANHPRTGVFHEGRFWLGGTPNEPQTFWGSKSNDYENFTLGSLADDALVFSIAKQGAIRWMASTKNLLVGTSNAEHIVTSVEGVITPGDIQVTQQSAYGSNNIQAVQVGDQMFYVSPDGQKLRAMQYEWTADNWLSNDITFFSQHITGSNIRQMAWAQNPDNQFCCVLNNGTLAQLTYERGEEIWGWHRHQHSDNIKDVTAARITGLDLLVFINNRVPGKLYLEFYTITNEQYMDSWIPKTLDPAGTTVTGLDHLEGREVQVITDGAVHPDRTVTGGQIELQWEATEVVVGLPFLAKARTLPLDKGAQTGGSAQVWQKRYNKIFVTLLDSARPLINGKRQPARTPSTPMDTREPNRSDRTFVVELGWDKNAQIDIEQDLPLPLTMVSIAGEVAQEIL